MSSGLLIRPRALALSVLFIVIATQFLSPLKALAQFSYGLDPVDTGVYGSGVDLGFGSGVPSGGSVPISTNPNDYSLGTPVTGTSGSGGAISTDPNNPNSYSTGTTEPVSTEVTEAYVESKIASWIHGIAIMIGGWVAGMGGNAFEYAFDIAVVKLGCQFVADGTGCANASINTQGAIGAVVNELWKIIRDVFNVIFIFGLIFLGLKTILQSDDSSTRKAISNLLIAALLVNFSLYFAKLLVDISNFTAVQIYSQMANGIGGVGYSIDPGAGSFSLGAGNKVAGAFMEVLKVASWFNTTMQGGIISQIGFAIMAMIFLIIVGAIFLYGAFMMLSRFIAIIILLIFSPAMFLGYVLPGFKSYSDKWRQMFVSYCFFAPAYVFMLYMSLYSLIQIAGAFQSASYGQAFNNGGQVTANSMGIFVFFFIGVGFLLASTKVAASMSSAGGGFIMKSGEKWARRMTLGAAGAAAVWSGGRIGSSAAGWTAEKIGKQWDEASASSDKPRGRTSIYLRNKLKSVESTKMGGATSYRSRQDERDTEAKRHARAQSLYGIDTAITTGSRADASVPEKIKMEEAISGASTSQILDMAKTGDGMKTLQGVAGSLTSSQVKAIMDSADITDDDKKKFGSKRVEAIKTKITNSGAPKPGKPEPTSRFGEGLKGAAASELEALDLEKDLMGNAIYLQSGQMDDLKKSWGADSTKFGLLKDAQKKAFDEAIANEEYTKIVESRKGTKEIAKLPDNVLENTAFIKAIKEKLSADLLGHVARESGANKKQVGKNVIDAFGGSYADLPNDIKKFMKSGQGALFIPAGVNVDND